MRTIAIALACLSMTACATAQERLETSSGPDAYWINSVPPEVAKMEAEDRKNAFYNQPLIKAYLTLVPLGTMVFFGNVFSMPTYVPPVPVP